MDLPLTHLPDYRALGKPASGGFISFIDAPVATDLESLDADVAILGVPYGMPYEMGQSWTFDAPRYLREKSLRFRRALGPYHSFDFGGPLLDGQDIRVVDCGDVPGDPADLRGNVERATRAVAAILARGAVPIVFGGDDAVPIPVVRAYEERGPIVVVQIDQHLDFTDEVDGVREGYSSPMRRLSEMPWVERIVQIGLHGTGSGRVADVEAAQAAGNLLIAERQVHEEGVETVLDRMPEGASYFITLDFDGLDPAICPAVSHPEPGGLSFAEAVGLLRGLATKGTVVGMDLVEFVPEHDLNGLGGHTAGRLVLNLINAMVRSGQFDRT
ncbi:MAG: agmatinase [Candidatus Latescibacteria bacterium]|jgi:agmatinase|nr:agmatinase [Candidatus Latescibacterota bacterium]